MIGKWSSTFFLGVKGIALNQSATQKKYVNNLVGFKFALSEITLKVVQLVVGKY